MQGFSLRAYRFRFVTDESVYFPVEKSGNIVRGAFGRLVLLGWRREVES